MKLIYLLSPAVGDERKALLSAVHAALPELSATLDETGTHLTLVCSTPLDVDGTVARLAAALAPFDRTVTELYRESDADFVPIHNTPLPPKKKRTVSLSTFLISLICAVLVVGVFAFNIGGIAATAFPALFGGSATLGTVPDENAESYVGKIGLVDAIFKEYSIYDIDGRLLLEEMLKAYALATGDKYAQYYTQEEFDALLETGAGSTVGLGITVNESKDPAGILVLRVMKGSVAEKAGILPRDVIVAIGSGENRVIVADKGFEASLALLKGEEGSTVEITVNRAGEELFFSMVRERLEIVTVTGKISATDPKVGIVTIDQFDMKTPSQFEQAMESLIAAGCERFVYDVRYNPGGDLKSVVAVLSFFLNPGDLIVSITDSTGGVTYQYAQEVSYTGDYADCSIESAKIGKYKSYPKAVVTNGQSASAAELFTAVLRDYELATLVGEKTFGKGILQTVVGLEQWGYTGGLRLTTGYYDPPKGKNYHDKGIEPHIKVEQTEADENYFLLPEEKDAQLLAAIAAVKS